LFFVMWTVQLITRAANYFIQWQRSRSSGSDQESWEIIEPAQRDDGTPIKAALSQIAKARQVFNGSTNGKNVRETGELETNFRHLGLKILIGVTAIALLVTIPILIIALR
ncbi:MAG: hypothetical protein QF704_05595, partial [Anaerolineales bacterium]|nr:hypothetical protein [Anaerolineales bacterium]